MSKIKPKYDRSKYTGIYGSWYAMKQRCGNPNHSAYHNYGGRGISYPQKWETFIGFQSDMNETYYKGLTLDRIDNNASYSLENCRWATRKVQCNNMRKNRLVEYKGERKTFPQWAEIMNIGLGTIRSRYYRGMSLDEIFRNRLYRPAKLAK